MLETGEHVLFFWLPEKLLKGWIKGVFNSKDMNGQGVLMVRMYTLLNCKKTIKTLKLLFCGFIKYQPQKNLKAIKSYLKQNIKSQ